MSHIFDLPPEILSRVFWNLSPYRDYQACRLVCRLWCEVITAIIEKKKYLFERGLDASAFSAANIEFYNLPQIPARFGHCACVVGRYMYVFGGKSAPESSFNDLWRFDLSERGWRRIITSGSFPSPKASASVVNYKGKLLLFGGCALYSSSQPNSLMRLYSDLHLFDTELHVWTELHPLETICPLAGHGATLTNHGKSMVVMGGLNSPFEPFDGCSFVFELNLQTVDWRQPITSSVPEGSNYGPAARYGHSQFLLGDNHILVAGGYTGHSKLDDMWLLDADNWQWTSIEVHDIPFSPPIIWGHAMVKVGDFAILLSNKRPQQEVLPPIGYQDNLSELNEDYGSLDTGLVNVKHRVLGRLWDKHVPTVDNQEDANGSTSSTTANGNDSPSRLTPFESFLINNTASNGRPIHPNKPISRRDKDKRLAALNFYEMFMENRVHMKNASSNRFTKLGQLCIFSLDLSVCLTEHVVRWRQPRYASLTDHLSDSIMHSAVLGHEEFIIFGGAISINPSKTQPNVNLSFRHHATNRVIVLHPAIDL